MQASTLLFPGPPNGCPENEEAYCFESVLGSLSFGLTIKGLPTALGLHKEPYLLETPTSALANRKNSSNAMLYPRGPRPDPPTNNRKAIYLVHRFGADFLFKGPQRAQYPLIQECTS